MHTVIILELNDINVEANGKNIRVDTMGGTSIILSPEVMCKLIIDAGYVFNDTNNEVCWPTIPYIRDDCHGNHEDKQ